jgi:hypothetical protein
MTLLVSGTLWCDAEAKYQEHCNTYYWWDYVGADYTSANPAIATVTSGGLVTGRSGGSTTITGSFTDYYYTYDSQIQDCVEHTRTRSDGASCKVYDATISSAKSINDGGTATFSVTPIGGTPTSYGWSFTSPSGAGNSPSVTFTPSNTQSTTTNGRWFALPNNACSAARSSVYAIIATVTFAGNLQKKPRTTLTINVPWDPGGLTPRPNITGSPAIAFDDSRQLWVVTGPGDLARVVQSPTIYVPTSSQFRNKVVTHENKHVQQWTSGMLSDLLQISSLMTVLSPLSDPTQSGLQSRIYNATATWGNNEVNIAASRAPAAETEAYAVSDPIAPQYLYQGCSQ